jgi:hypothetical protein
LREVKIIKPYCPELCMSFEAYHIVSFRVHLDNDIGRPAVA